MNQDKREKIIEISRKIFSHFGVKKSTMDEIANKIRMGKSTLYHYFKSKEEIFLEVVKKEAHTLKSKINQVLKEAKTPQDKFRAYSKARIQYLREMRNYYATLTDDYMDIYNFSKEVREDFANFELNTIIGIFQEGIQKGVFDIKNPRITAKMVIIAFKGFEYLMVTKDEAPEVENELDHLIDIFFKGIEKKPCTSN